MIVFIICRFLHNISISCRLFPGLEKRECVDQNVVVRSRFVWCRLLNDRESLGRLAAHGSLVCDSRRWVCWETFLDLRCCKILSCWLGSLLLVALALPKSHAHASLRLMSCQYCSISAPHSWCSRWSQQGRGDDICIDYIYVGTQQLVNNQTQRSWSTVCLSYIFEGFWCNWGKTTENTSFVGRWIPAFGLLATEANAMETRRVEARAQTRTQTGKLV